MPTKPLDELLPVISQAVEEWKAVNTPEKVTDAVKQKLDKNSDSIVMSLLGFKEDTWNKKWELDHCNGRSGESAAGDYIRRVQQDAIMIWLSQVSMPELPATVHKQMQAEMKGSFIKQVNKRVDDLVKDKANQIAAALVADITKSDNLPAFMKAIQLISPQE